MESDITFEDEVFNTNQSTLTATNGNLVLRFM